MSIYTTEQNKASSESIGSTPSAWSESQQFAASLIPDRIQAVFEPMQQQVSRGNGLSGG